MQIIPCEYNSIEVVDSGTVIALKDGVYSLFRLNEYSTSANFPVPVVLMSDFEDMRAIKSDDGTSWYKDEWKTQFIAAKKAGLWGLYNADGVCVVQPEYHDIYYCDDVTVVVKERSVGVYREPT